MKVIKEGVISAPVQKVFDFVSDLERRPLFVPNLVGIRNVTPPERGVGQSWDFQFSLFGAMLNGKGSCTLYEPHTRYGFRTEGDVFSTWLYTFTSEADRTRLLIEIEYDPPASVLAKIANSVLLSRLNENDAERGIHNLKTILED